MSFENQQQQKIVGRLAEEQDALWRQLAAHTNEMVIRKMGKSIYPLLEYHIEGLNANKMYEMVLEIRRVDDSHYRFSKGKWIDDRRSYMTAVECDKTRQKIWHGKGLMSGKEWMTLPTVKFDNFKLTNYLGHTSRSHVFLQSSHKYVPVLSIYEEMEDCSPPYQLLKLVAKVRIKHTEFIATTSYKNKAVSSLKIASNPHAICYRQDKRRRPSSSSSTEDISSPPSKQAKYDEPSSHIDASYFPDSDLLPVASPNLIEPLF